MYFTLNSRWVWWAQKSFCSHDLAIFSGMSERSYIVFISYLLSLLSSDWHVVSYNHTLVCLSYRAPTRYRYLFQWYFKLWKKNWIPTRYNQFMLMNWICFIVGRVDLYERQYRQHFSNNILNIWTYWVFHLLQHIYTHDVYRIYIERCRIRRKNHQHNT